MYAIRSAFSDDLIARMVFRTDGTAVVWGDEHVHHVPCGSAFKTDLLAVLCVFAYRVGHSVDGAINVYRGDQVLPVENLAALVTSLQTVKVPLKKTV